MALGLLGKLYVAITGDNSHLDASIDQAKRTSEKGAREVSAAWTRGLERMAQVGATLTRFVTLPLAALGVAAVKAAIDAEETGSKFRTAFRGAEEAADAAAEALRRGYGLSRTESERLLSATGDLLKGFGATAREALGLSNRVQELAVDLASYNNVEGGASRASEILTKAMLGEREGLTQLGIKISEMDVQQRLAAQGMSELQGRALLLAKAQATLDLAMEQSGDAIGDFARTAESPANQLRILKAQVQDAAVSLGRDLLPAARDLIGVARDVVGWFNSLSESQRQNIIRFAAFAAAIGPVATGISTLSRLISANPYVALGLAIGGVVAAAATWIKSNKEAQQEEQKLLEKLKGTTGAVDEQTTALAENTAARYQSMVSNTALVIAGLQKEKEALDREVEAIQRNRNLTPGQQMDLIDLTEARRRLTDQIFANTQRLKVEQQMLAEASRVAGENRRETRGATDDRKDATGVVDGYAAAMRAAARATEEETSAETDAALSARTITEMLLLTREAQRNKEEADRQAAVERQRSLIQDSFAFAAEMAGAFSQISSNLAAGRLQEVDEEYQHRREAIEANVTDEADRAAALQALDDETAAKKKAIEREEAKRQKRLRIFETIINTARGIAEAIPNLAKMAFAAVAGAAQLAAIAAQPIPAARGLDIMTREPTVILAGDNPGGQERVQITPVSSPNMAGPEESFLIENNISIADEPLFRVISRGLRRKRLLVPEGSVVQS